MIEVCASCKKKIGKKNKAYGDSMSKEEHAELCTNNEVSHGLCKDCKSVEKERAKNFWKKDKEKKKQNDIANECLGKYIRKYL